MVPVIVILRRPAWSSELVPGQPGLHRETLTGINKNKQKIEYAYTRELLWGHTTLHDHNMPRHTHMESTFHCGE